MESRREDSTRTYTYRDYLSWPEGERWELLEGVPRYMTPGPSRIHQKVSRELLYSFHHFLRDKSCEVYGAPFDVRLPLGEEEDQDIQTVVQPDIIVVCDLSKLDERGCKGAPDLVVEIVSPSNLVWDIKKKFDLYERAGVREYWIVYPEDKVVTVFKLGDNRRYGRPDVYAYGEKIVVGLFSDLVIDLEAVFPG